MGFLSHGPLAHRGLIDPAPAARPDKPATALYGGLAERGPKVAELRHRGKFDAAGPGLRLPLALHHVVPWATLVGFWNALAGHGHYAPLREFATLFGRPKEQTKYWPDDMANGRFWDRHGRTDLPRDLCWWPWNLVRGPAHRPQATSRQYRNHPAADPGDAADDLSRGHAAHAAHIRAMLEVGRVMAGVVRDPATAGGDALTGTVRGWLALSGHPIIEFTPDAWRVDRDGPAYAVRGNEITWPVWFKRTPADG